MRVGRRVVRCAAWAWLAAQLAAFAAAPIVLCAHAQEPGPHQAACCPGTAPGQICPMHHAREGTTSKCRMGNACRASDAALLSLFTTAGVATPTAMSIQLTSTSDRVDDAASTPIVRAALPESPPPRI